MSAKYWIWNALVLEVVLTDVSGTCRSLVCLSEVEKMEASGLESSLDWERRSPKDPAVTPQSRSAASTYSSP